MPLTERRAAWQPTDVTGQSQLAELPAIGLLSYVTSVQHGITPDLEVHAPCVWVMVYITAPEECWTQAAVFEARDAFFRRMELHLQRPAAIQVRLVFEGTDSALARVKRQLGPSARASIYLA